MKLSLTDVQINKAVEWWVAALQNPQYDNGDLVHGLMAQVAYQNLVPTESTLATFRRMLSRILHDEFDAYCLRVDYEPDQWLYTAAERAGIPAERFPWKTIMWFENGGVQVAYGYGAPIEEI